MIKKIVRFKKNNRMKYNLITLIRLQRNYKKKIKKYFKGQMNNQ